MKILNVGPLELIFVIVIALVILGPDEIVSTSRRLAKYINQIIKSPVWRSLVNTSKEIRDLPLIIAREAGIEDCYSEISELNRVEVDSSKKDRGEDTIERNIDRRGGVHKEEHNVSNFIHEE